MEKHVTVLGVLYIAFSALGILAAIIVFVAIVGGGILSKDSEAMTITAIVGPVIAFFLLIVSMPGFVGGIFLLRLRPWARILILILGFLNLLNIPFGTILGIYTIWVLLKNDTIQLFVAEPIL